MNDIPVLQTENLLLRQHTIEDAQAIANHLASGEVGDTTASIPSPYTINDAIQWLDSLPAHHEQGNVDFAITIRNTGELIGNISLKNVDKSSERAELGYWLARPFWNNGYGTEAATAVINYGFRELGLNRIFAIHFQNNPASGRIMQKIGMKYEGCLRQNTRKNGIYMDCEIYSILKDEYTPKPDYVKQNE